MQAGLWGHRGFNHFIDSAGTGFYFSIQHKGRSWDRFFYNVGQPLQQPPRHEMHVDDLRFCDAIRIHASSFDPWYASYSLFDNSFFWFKSNDLFLLKAELRDEFMFLSEDDIHRCEQGWIRLSNDFYVWGADIDHSQKGSLQLVISRSIIPNVEKLLQDIEIPIVTTDISVSALSRHVVFYNMSVSDLLQNRFYVPVNKAWQPMIARVTQTDEAKRGPMIFAWDASFSCIILSRFDIEMACSTFFALLEAMQLDGRIPQLRIGDRFSNRSNPPVWFLAAWEIYLQSQDMDFLSKVYPGLLKNYQWWKQNRMHSDNSFSWGTDNEDDPDLILLKSRAGAMYESGLDDSPLWDEMNMVTEKRANHEIELFDQSCIDLTSLMILSVEMLINMASVLDRDTSDLKSDLESYEAVLHRFFDNPSGSVNSILGTKQNTQMTPASLYPLLCSGLDKEELSLLENILLSDQFDVHGMLPSLSSHSVHYTGDGDYWRGRVWPPMVWLICYGLKKQGSVYYEKIKSASEKMMRAEWDRHGHIHENYSSKTGNGEPEPGTYARSCPFYSWGGLLGIL